LKHLAVEIADIDRTRKVCKGLENQIDYLNTICGGGVSILDVLKELSQKIPESAWVRGFEFSETGVKIQGEAGSASELIPLLEASPLFNGVAFLSTITKGRDGKDRFRIGLELK